MHFDTKPIFVVGCGRSGTQALARLLDIADTVEMHHEYMVHHIQPLGVQYFHGLIRREDVLEKLATIYAGAIHYCPSEIWGDSSNKVSWLIGELAELFPTAKFVHVVRDGRKVTSSLFNKLGDECLDDASVEIMSRYLNAPQDSHVCPPPEKKYWWPCAKEAGDSELYSTLDQYGRIAYHWAQINEEIEKQFSMLPNERCLKVRLEDITSDKQALAAMMQFVGIPDKDEYFTVMQRPHNVVRPENNPLTEAQLTVFWKLCADTMEKYGYSNTDEYMLNYAPQNAVGKSR
ncbi:MAG: sulfotransferase [Kordiimonadaceae bacterium]|nr:sulfotransferase [Kordiimonadaceae bacterium]